MTGYERQILETERSHDVRMEFAELQDIEVLESLVGDNRLDEILNSPHDERVDQR